MSEKQNGEGRRSGEGAEEGGKKIKEEKHDEQAENHGKRAVRNRGKKRRQKNKGLFEEEK
jgi:hypothetical protein